jgi:hypothetical protein
MAVNEGITGILCYDIFERRLCEKKGNKRARL